MPVPTLRSLSELAPAALIALVVTGVGVATQLVPLGETTVLVRVPADTSAAGMSALAAAAAADAALVSIPAPGFAVLHGDAARIRTAVGLAVIWQGTAPCSPKQ